jgi:hypothetical protein
MPDHQDPKLDTVLADLQLRFGSRIIAPANAADTIHLSTGSATLDEALGGGLAPRKLTQIAGHLTSGITSLALQVVARTQADGGHVVYIDQAGHFDSDTAKRRGINLPELLLARSLTAQSAMIFVNRVLSNGASSLIVLDACRATLSASEADGRRLRQVLAASQCTLLLFGQTLPAALTAIAETRINLELVGVLRQDEQLNGLQSRAIIEDARGERTVSLETYYGRLAS